MNTTQLTALSAAIAADSTLASHADLNEFPQIADAMNVVGTTTIWMPCVPAASILSAILVADMSGLTAAQLAYLQMLLAPGTIDATSQNVRTNFGSIFAGKTSLTNLSNVSARKATRFEALNAFITAASPNNVSSAFGVVVSAYDVQTALGK